MHGCRIANDALSPRDLICTFMTSEYDMNTLHNDTIPDGIKNAPSKCIDITNHYCTADAGCLPLRSFNIRIAGNSSTYYGTMQISVNNLSPLVTFTPSGFPAASTGRVTVLILQNPTAH